MKKKFYYAGLVAILFLSTSGILSSCEAPDDEWKSITYYNQLQGTYIVTGKVYNYAGAVSWTGPPAAIPNNYTSSVNLSTVSPKTLVAKTGTVTWGNFADFVSPDYYYIFTSSSDFSTLSYDLSSVPGSSFSNITKYVVSYTPPSATQKAVFHIITHYNDNATGTGNSRIVDETFTQQ